MSPPEIKKFLQFQYVHVIVGLAPVPYKKAGKLIEVFPKLQTI